MLPEIEDEDIGRVAWELAMQAPTVAAVRSLSDNDEVMVAVKYEPNEDITLKNFSYLGRVEWRVQGADLERPEGFDPKRSEIVHAGRQGLFWWEPPAELANLNVLGEGAKRSLRREVRDAAVFGFSSMTVEVMHFEGDEHVRSEVASCPDLEPFVETEHLAELIEDLTRVALNQFA